MAQLATKTAEQADAVAGVVPVIDRGHLGRMTFGDRSLERELLNLFGRQAELLVARMRDGDAASIAALAHTLKGSAAGIGACRVAQTAEAAERAAASGPAALKPALDGLADAVAQARAHIATLLRAG
jgi:HPt (histidine-containing phosphotransfer) domain-containing protein